MSDLKAESLSYKSGGTMILSDVNLVFRQGELTAIIGPSGSGKSTLVKCLTTAHRPTRGTVCAEGGDIWKMRHRYRQILGYVPQDDIIHPQLTVQQAFFYASKLRLDTDVGEAAIRKRIDAIAGMLGLAEQSRRRIYKLSGGQRKRVNIGIELLADPSILILDEPASGLDPGTEEDLVKLLGSLADSGRTVVTTTHSMEYLSAFDQIVLLASGRVIFSGLHQELLAHFGVTHAADVFKAIRQKDASYWVSSYNASPLSRKALGG
ncbi:MAG: ABC transporter ATP-binding protein [Elusimicrobia bacterium]|nr:ABC transporter ATP-binding protein [Elusimicrobiota bacterium]